MEVEKMMEFLEERIKFHRESIERFKTYGRPMHEDVLISNGQITEDEVIISWLFEIAYEQKKGGMDHGSD